jgi:hypothetical protein
MDSEHWISRLAAAKRFYAAQLGHADRGAGMDELDVDEDAAAAMPEFACPYCYEDHDVASLCAHLEEEHPFEPHAAPCPICSDKISKDMINHITMQHGYLFKVTPLLLFLLPFSSISFFNFRPYAESPEAAQIPCSRQSVPLSAEPRSTRSPFAGASWRCWA